MNIDAEEVRRIFVWRRFILDNDSLNNVYASLREKKNLGVLGVFCCTALKQFLSRNTRWHVDEPATHMQKKKLTEHSGQMHSFSGRNIYICMYGRLFNMLLSEEYIIFIRRFPAKVVFE